MDRPTITIGNVNIGPGATGIVGVNQFGSDNDNPESKLNSCIEAFYVTDPKADRDELINIKGGVTDGTCHWIRDDETYKAWLDNEHSQLLWISGSPGQGKTMLSIFLTNELESLTDDATHVLFYFCSHRNEEKSTATAVLRTLLHQIFQRRAKLAQHALSRMGTARRAEDALNSRAILWQILLDVLNDTSLGPVVCLLDGIDECKDDSMNRLITDLRIFFGLSGRAARQTPNTFKIVVLSRKIVGLHGFLRLDLESKTKDITSDVHQFLDAKIKEHPVYPTIDGAFWNMVTSMIRQRCNGTFLWAGLVLNEILSKDNQTEMGQILEEVPEGLDAIYARILSNIPSRWRQDVARLLHWVASAIIPLSVSQVAEAWYPECEDRNAEIQKVRDLVSMSGSLLKTDEWCCAERLSLIHSSVGDYLMRPIDEEDENHAPRGFQLESQAVHREMAEMCLRSCSALVPLESRHNIREPGIHVTQLNDHMFLEERNFNYQWISYAVYTWPSHAKACAEAADGLVNFDLPFFHHRSPIRDEWHYVFTHPLGKKGDVVEVEQKDISLLHILPALGLTYMISKVLRRMRHQDEDYINRMQGGHTALCHAAFFGHEDTVDLLLAEGARVTEGHSSNGCALQAAFQRQHYRIAKTLLEHVCSDANESPVPRQERAPTSLTNQLLYHAFGGHDVRLVKLLYDNGMATSLDQEAVRYALATGSGPIFEFLLDQGFDPNAVDEGSGLTPLVIAVFRSDSEAAGVAEVLLRRGADVDERDRHGQNALHWAACRNDGALIPTLLAHGADLKATTATVAGLLRPIEVALLTGSLKAAEMLLDASMDTEVEVSFDQKTFRALNFRMKVVDDHPEEMLRLARMLVDDIDLPQRICEKLLQRGVDINLGGLHESTTLDTFGTTLRPYRSAYVLFLLQNGARCKSAVDTEKLIEALARLSDDWDTESE